MTPTRKRRLIAVIVIIIGVGLAAVVAIKSLNENMLFFVSPTDVEEQSLPAGKRFRLGGLVTGGSLSRASDSLAITFTVTDGANSVDVRYDGILPDLHDEKYMPPEVADALEKAGHRVAEE